MNPTPVPIRGQHIGLVQALKIAGLAESRRQAYRLVVGGDVTVNGLPVRRLGRKLVTGEWFAFGDREWVIQALGKVLVSAKIENLDDLFRAARGEISPDQIRVVTVANALVDTGATTLLLPRKLVAQLGLVQFHSRPARSLGGPVETPIYSAVRLTIQERQCHLDVGEIDDGFPVIIGQIPLEMLDWVVDPKSQRLIGNPEHGGQQILEVF